MDTDEFEQGANRTQDVKQSIAKTASVANRTQDVKQSIAKTASVPAWESYPAKLWMQHDTGLWSSPTCRSRKAHGYFKRFRNDLDIDFYQSTFKAVCLISRYDYDASTECSKTRKCLQELWKDDIGFLCPEDYSRDSSDEWQNTYFTYNMEALLADQDGVLEKVAQSTFARFEAEQAFYKASADKQQTQPKFGNTHLQAPQSPKDLHILRFEWVPLVRREQVVRISNNALAGVFQCHLWNQVFEKAEKENNQFTKKYDAGTDVKDVYWTEFQQFAKKRFSGMLDIPKENAENLAELCRKCFPSAECKTSVGSHLVPGRGVVKIYAAVDDGPLLGPDQSKGEAAMKAAYKQLNPTARNAGLHELLKASLHTTSWTSQMRKELSSEIGVGASYYPKLNYLKIPLSDEMLLEGVEIGQFASDLASTIRFC